MKNNNNTEHLPKIGIHASIDKGYIQDISLETREEYKKNGITLPDNSKGVSHTLNVYLSGTCNVDYLDDVLKYKAVISTLKSNGITLFSDNIISFNVYKSYSVKTNTCTSIHYKIGLNIKEDISFKYKTVFYEISTFGKIISKETDFENKLSPGVSQRIIFWYSEMYKNFTLEELALIANIDKDHKVINFKASEGRRRLPESVEEYKYTIDIS